jgi:hypothetical protein
MKAICCGDPVDVDAAVFAAGGVSVHRGARAWRVSTDWALPLDRAEDAFGGLMRIHGEAFRTAGAAESEF